MLFKFGKLLLCTLFLPLWWSQKLLPRKENVWVFGAWFGQRYGDNCRVFFEYVNHTAERVDAIWLTASDQVREELISKGYKCYKIWSIQGIWYSLKAGKVFFSSGKKDINQFFINGAKVFNMWHGAPLKKIGESNKFTKSISNKFIYDKLFTFLNGLKFDTLVSPGSFFNKYFAEAFALQPQQIISVGYPRNDVLLKSNRQHAFFESEQFKGKKIVFYMPTFRDTNAGLDLFGTFGFEERAIKQVLENESAVFIYKFHFAAIKPLNGFRDERILDFDDLGIQGELYDFLANVDVLITDYSSVYFDFLLTEKSIILTPFDIESYLNNDREFYFEYDELDCDLVCHDWTEVVGCLSDAINQKNTQKIIGAKYKFNSNLEGDSCEKLIEELLIK